VLINEKRDFVSIMEAQSKEEEEEEKMEDNEDDDIHEELKVESEVEMPARQIKFRSLTIKPERESREELGKRQAMK